MLKLKDGSSIDRIGQGTWKMGENPNSRESEIKALKKGLELGMTLIDTAEMYGDGRTESLIGEAIADYPRQKLYLISKVYPFHAGKGKIFESCDASLKRLGIDYLDMYLLHWRGNIPLSETVACMEELVKRGKIRRWGVSNFDLSDMEELLAVKNGEKCTINQVLYHLGSRGIEYDLIPWQQEKGIPVMAYCPIAQAGNLKCALKNSAVLEEIARKYGATIYQILLSFVLANGNVIAIPKASKAGHVKENYEALKIKLDEKDIEKLNLEFPAPKRKVPLDIE